MKIKMIPHLHTCVLGALMTSAIVCTSSCVSAQDNPKKVTHSTADSSSKYDQEIEDLIKVFTENISAQEFEKSEATLAVFKSTFKEYIETDMEAALKKIEQLEKEYGIFTINKSPDNKLIAINWDDGLGGTMRFFDGVFAVQNNGKWKASDMKVGKKDEVNLIYAINQVQTADKKTVYLFFEVFIGSTALTNHTVKTVTVENGKVNTKAKFIKTGSGIRNDINYTMDWSELSNRNNDIDSDEANMTFDSKKNSFSLPVIQKDGKLTSNKIIYTFNGKYFEKSK